MTPSHTLKRIRLNLAKSKEFPSGSSCHGYELIAPLDQFGHIDPQLWDQYQHHCRVRRFWEGEDDQLVLWPSSRKAQSTLAGCSIATPKRGWMTSQAIVSGRTFAPGDTSRSMTNPATCTPAPSSLGSGGLGAELRSGRMFEVHVRGHLAAECRVRPPRHPAAVIQRIRPTSSEEIIGVAEQVTRRLIQAYAAPDRALLSYGSTSRRR